MTVDESQRVVVTAELAEPGLVVLADAFHPDWTLTVSSDGADPRPLPIRRVNRIHRGCSLPAGRHVLEFRYHSKTFARTIWITLAAWGSAAVAGGAGRLSSGSPHPMTAVMRRSGRIECEQPLADKKLLLKE